MKRTRAILIGALLWAAATPAAAQESADALIDEGVTLREQGRDEDALERFTRAHGLTPSGRALAQIAFAEQALGRWVSAERHLVEALATDDPWVGERRAPAEAALAVIRTHIGALELHGGVAGAEVRIDGEPSGTLPLAQPMRIAAGSVRLEVRAQGHLAFERTVVVPAGGSVTETVALVARQVEGADEPPNIAGAGSGEWRPGDLLWVGTAAAALGIIGGVTFGLLCLSEISNFDSQPSNDIADRAMAFGVTADVSFGIAALGAVLAIIGLATGEVAATPNARASLRGGRLAIRF